MILISIAEAKEIKANEACATPNFSGGKAIPLASSAGVIASGDFNNDGKRDVAVALSDFSNTRIEVELGDGNGNFTSAGVVSTPDYISNLVAADIDNDGNLDLVITNRNSTASDKITVFTGDGAGHFTYKRSIGLEGEPSFIAVDDFNGDDRLDFAVTIPALNKAAVFRRQRPIRPDAEQPRSPSVI